MNTLEQRLPKAKRCVKRSLYFFSAENTIVLFFNAFSVQMTRATKNTKGHERLKKAFRLFNRILYSEIVFLMQTRALQKLQGPAEQSEAQVMSVHGIMVAEQTTIVLLATQGILPMLAMAPHPLPS